MTGPDFNEDDLVWRVAHLFHDDEPCFPGCPAWTTNGPVCHATITTVEGKRVCFRPLEDGVCPVHGDPDVIARMMSDAEDDLAEGR